MSERVQTCECGTQFVFRQHHESGKANPIEVDPVPDGNVAILADGKYRIIGKGEGHEGDRYRSHFAFCPSRTKFLKKKDRR